MTVQPIPTTGPQDRIWIHLAWEAVVALLVLALTVLVVVQVGSVPRAANVIIGSTVGLLPLAIAFSISLRAAAPNLAVAAIGTLGGGIVAQTSADGGSVMVGVLLAVGAGLAVGVVLGLVVVALHVPAWAASLVVVLGLNAAALALLDGRAVPLGQPLGQAGQTIGLVGFAVLSIAGGALFAVPVVRRWFGAARADRDPARRPPIQSAIPVFLALTASSGVAAVGGVIWTYRVGAAVPLGGFDVIYVLVAVTLGGASLYGRRAGIFGTLLGSLAVALVGIATTLLDADTPMRNGAVMALGVLGLVATLVVETLGRERDRTARNGPGGGGAAGPQVPYPAYGPPGQPPAYAPVGPPPPTG